MLNGRLLALRGLAIIGAVSLGAGVAGALVLRSMVRHGFSARDQPSGAETMLARSLREWSIPSETAQRRNPIKPSSEILAGAREHWADHCAKCHANDGSGDTPMGRSLYPKAPDMRLSPTQKLSDGELFAIIQNGIRLSGMPAWGEPAADDPDTWALVHFIRHLPALHEEELEEMKRLNPKSPSEIEEERDEELFLNGGADGTAGRGSPTAPHQQRSTQ